ncbi:MAG TPA: FAD-binding protein, partial [Candidatus Hypogeohydataceae bacterium YC40]
VGGGLAGLRAAIAVNERNVSVAVLSKVHPLRSHSVAAQGGVNAPLGNHPRGSYDNWEKHAYDTIKGSDFLADQDSVIRMTREAAARIVEMEHWGCPFSRTPEGKIAQRPFGGAGFPRTCYVADTTGHAMLHTVYEQTVRFQQAAERKEMVVYPEWLITNLVVEGEECRGVVAMEMDTGRLEAFMAEAVIFATGGAGRLYGNSTNALINTGMGLAVPYWAGIPLKDMEFIQFHPTTLYGKNILITEGARGEGAFLLNNKGERFLANYPDSRKSMEVAPRDIVSRNIAKELLEGRGFEGAYLLLDLRHLGREKITTRLPGIRDICLEFAGIDPIDEPIPVQPGQHYTMGGIDCNTECETRVKGFYAAGEAACVSVHGANRLGGNSLLDTLVFGHIAGARAAEYVQGKTKREQGKKVLEETLAKVEKKIPKLLASTGTELPSKIRNEMQGLMLKKAGIFRDAQSLKEALSELRSLKERYKDIRINYNGRIWNQALALALELEGSLDVAEAVVTGALAREESRGSHFRTDSPKRDDQNWLRHTLCFFTPEGPRLEYSAGRPGPFKIEERRY